MTQQTNYDGLQFPFYPFLIAISPVLSLYFINSTTLGLLDLIRPILVYLAIAALAMLTARVIGPHFRAAALLSTILLAGFLSYGAIAKIVYSHFSQQGQFPIYWTVLILGVFLVSSMLIRHFDSTLRKTTVVFNVFAIVLALATVTPLLMIPEFEAPTRDQKPITRRIHNHEWLSNNPTLERRERPDFYYLILDAYARADILQSRFDYDNTNAIQWLEREGFFVGKKSHANYPWTHLSLCSTFNGEYLQTLIPAEISLITPGSNKDRFLFVKQFIEDNFTHQNNRLLSFFEALGYNIIANNSGSSLTRKRPKSLLQALTSPLNEFEEELFNRSLAQPLYLALRGLRPVKGIELAGADKVLGMLNDFADATQYEGPKFVIAHILSPHTPFTFDASGNGIPRHPVYDASPWMSDRLKYPGFREWYEENYPKNVAGLNIHLKRILESLLISTDGNAVIIVQSDHGSSLGMDQQNIDVLDVEERFGILNAIYIPKSFPREGLVDSMSAINTFPIVLNNVFELSIPVREDRAYFSTGDLNFHDVTDRVRRN